MSLMHIRGIEAGPGLVFTYGPLGFLAFPNLVWLRGALLGLAYISAATFAFHYLVCRALNDWLPAFVALVITAALALVVAATWNVPEIATAAVFLWALRLVKPEVLSTRLPIWVCPALGCVSALSLLVKFGSGGAALAAGLVVAVARPRRLENLGVLVAAFVTSFVVFWVAAGQSLPNVPLWTRESLQLAAGYSSAMALQAGFHGTRFWLLWLAVVGVLAVRLWKLGSERRGRAVPTIALIVLATWFFTKEGFTRLEQGHADIAYFVLAALVAAVPWERRRPSLGLVGLAFALSAVLAASGSVGTYPTRLKYLATLQPRHGLGQAAQIVRAAVEPSFRSRKLEAARQALLTAYGMHPVVPGLLSSQIHVDPWEIGTVWAYGLQWRPVPAIQAYSAYSPSLDDLNADSLRSSDGPDAVIRADPYLSIGNVPAWESPDYMVALTCGYAVTDATPGWQVLKRRSDACGPPHQTSQTTARHGQTVRVPTVRFPDDIMVATFSYPTPLVERLTTLLIKPSRLPKVLVDGSPNGFLAATASQFHLVRVPTTIRMRHITNAGLDIRTLSFPNAPGSVTIRFYEIATR